jgi:uncharacterized protein (DUF58 family)
MKWVVSALGLLALGLVFGMGSLVYAMYVLLAVLIVSRYLAWQWIENLGAERACDRARAQIGEVATVVVTLRNGGTLPIPWVLIEDSLTTEVLTPGQRRLEVQGERAQIIRLGAKAEVELEYRVEFRARGYYQIGPLLAESGDLFGLHRRFRVLGEPDFVTVYPKVVPVAGYDLASRRPMGEVRMTHRLFEDPTRISGVRLYQLGDAMNRIHWRATARTGRLHSKTYEPSCVAGATLLLDFHSGSYGGPGAGYCAELAVTAAVSMANAVCELGQQVGFISNGRDAADRIREEGWRHEFRTRGSARQNLGLKERSDRLAPLVVETRQGVEQFAHILETAARIELTDGLTLPQLIVEIESRLPRDATIIVIAAEVTEEAAIALGGLRRGGYAVTVILVSMNDHGVHDWAEPPEWAGRLAGQGIDFRCVFDESSLAAVCSEKLLL